MIKRCLLVSAMLLVTACSSFVSAPKVELKRTTLSAVDTSGAEVDFYLGITNPNPFDLTLLGYTYDLKVMALPLIAGGRQEVLQFKSSRETDLRLPVRIRYADLLQLLKQRPDFDKIPYELHANLQLRTFMGEIVIPVESKSTFSVPEKFRPGHYLERFNELLKPLSP
jgi:LEA14-like dessication related protein